MEDPWYVHVSAKSGDMFRERQDEAIKDRRVPARGRRSFHLGTNDWWVLLQ